MRGNVVCPPFLSVQKIFFWFQLKLETQINGPQRACALPQQAPGQHSASCLVPRGTPQLLGEYQRLRVSSPGPSAPPAGGLCPTPRPREERCHWTLRRLLEPPCGTQASPGFSAAGGPSGLRQLQLCPASPRTPASSSPSPRCRGSCRRRALPELEHDALSMHDCWESQKRRPGAVRLHTLVCKMCDYEIVNINMQVCKIKAVPSSVT